MSERAYARAVDLTGAAHVPDTVVAASAAPITNQDTEFLLTTSNGKSWHTIRDDDGTWDGAGNIARALGSTRRPRPPRGLEGQRSDPAQYVIAA